MDVQQIYNNSKAADIVQSNWDINYIFCPIIHIFF